MSKKYTLLTFKGICMNFLLEFKKKCFKSPSDLLTASQNRPNTYETPCNLLTVKFSHLQVRIKSLALEQQDVDYNPFRCNRKQTYPKNQGLNFISLYHNFLATMVIC